MNDAVKGWIEIAKEKREGVRLLRLRGVRRNAARAAFLGGVCLVRAAQHRTAAVDGWHHATAEAAPRHAATEAARRHEREHGGRPGRLHAARCRVRLAVKRGSGLGRTAVRDRGTLRDGALCCAAPTANHGFLHLRSRRCHLARFARGDLEQLDPWLTLRV